jgi:hypothetical protein
MNVGLHPPDSETKFLTVGEWVQNGGILFFFEKSPFATAKELAATQAQIKLIQQQSMPGTYPVRWLFLISADIFSRSQTKQKKR